MFLSDKKGTWIIYSSIIGASLGGIFGLVLFITPARDPILYGAIIGGIIGFFIFIDFGDFPTMFIVGIIIGSIAGFFLFMNPACYFILTGALIGWIAFAFFLEDTEIAIFGAILGAGGGFIVYLFWMIILAIIIIGFILFILIVLFGNGSAPAPVSTEYVSSGERNSYVDSTWVRTHIRWIDGNPAIVHGHERRFRK